MQRKTLKLGSLEDTSYRAAVARSAEVLDALDERSDPRLLDWSVELRSEKKAEDIVEDLSGEDLVFPVGCTLEDAVTEYYQKSVSAKVKNEKYLKQ